MFAVLLLTTLLAAPLTHKRIKPRAPQPEDLAQPGNYKAALEGFRRLVAADPGDLEARVSIGGCTSGGQTRILPNRYTAAVVLEDPG